MFRRLSYEVHLMLNSCDRTSPSEFIVPFDQYMESVKANHSIGMRFKMRFEGEEAPEQRYKSAVYCGLFFCDMQLIVGIGHCM